MTITTNQNESLLSIPLPSLSSQRYNHYKLTQGNFIKLEYSPYELHGILTEQEFQHIRDQIKGCTKKALTRTSMIGGIYLFITLSIYLILYFLARRFDTPLLGSIGFYAFIASFFICLSFVISQTVNCQKKLVIELNEMFKHKYITFDFKKDINGVEYFNIYFPIPEFPLTHPQQYPTAQPLIFPVYNYSTPNQLPTPQTSYSSIDL